MDKKTIIGIIILLIGSATAGAIIGTEITKGQFDKMDFTTYSLEIGIISKEKTSDAIVIHISYEMLEEQDNSNWKTIQATTELTFPLETYHECRVGGNTKETCVQGIIDSLIEEAQFFKDSTRNTLKNSQTKTYTNEITIEDIKITNEELNKD